MSGLKIKLLLLCSVLLIITGIILIRHYLNVPQNNYKEKISQLERLIKEGVVTQAVYDSVYTEFKKNGQTLSKTFNYSYKVKDKLYKDEVSLGKVPEELTFEVFYLPENPEVHSRNPKDDCESYKTRLANEVETPTITWVLFVSAIAVIIYLVVGFRNEQNLEKEFQDVMNK